jgi:hypothetical protein
MHRNKETIMNKRTTREPTEAYAPADPKIEREHDEDMLTVEVPTGIQAGVPKCFRVVYPAEN